MLKLDRRFSKGLTMQWSYAFSKILTDSDTYYANAGFAEDQGNRGLEKSIGAYDQTHVVKLNTHLRTALRQGQALADARRCSSGAGRLADLGDSGLCERLSRSASPATRPMSIFNGVNRPYITSYNWKPPLLRAASIRTRICT